MKRRGFWGLIFPALLMTAALDALYPPKAQGPIFLVKMIALAESFGRTLGDLFENDLPNALANLEKFKTQYKELSGFVPELLPAVSSGPYSGCFRPEESEEVAHQAFQ